MKLDFPAIRLISLDRIKCVYTHKNEGAYLEARSTIYSSFFFFSIYNKKMMLYLLCRLKFDERKLKLKKIQSNNDPI